VIDGLKPYPDYRHSEDRWLQEVPSSWEKVRIKYLLREIDRRTQTGEEPLLSMRRDHGLVPLSQFSDKVAEPKALLAYKLVEPGELVVNRMQAGNGLVFVARIPGLISPDYAIFRPVREVNLDYLELLFRSYPMRAKFRSESTGLGTGTAGFLRLYGDSLGAIEIGLPSADEQSQIVRFLGYADRQIRRYIRDKKRLIALLNEQRQAIVLRAVTLGVNRAVPLKPSGVEWLGDVPEHWHIGRIKSELTSLNTRRVPLSSTERGKMTRRQYDYYGASGVIDKVDDYLFEDDLLLIAEDGANLVLRNLPLAIIARGRFWVNNHAHILKPRRGSLEYFAALLECIEYLPWISGAAQPKLTQDRLMSVRIPVPPVSEQAAIISWIKASTTELEAVIKKARSEVDLLGELRARVVADVATGKIDVREAAIRLPEASTTLDEESLLEDAAEADSSELDDSEAESIA